MVLKKEENKKRVIYLFIGGVCLVILLVLLKANSGERELRSGKVNTPAGFATVCQGGNAYSYFCCYGTGANGKAVSVKANVKNGNLPTAGDVNGDGKAETVPQVVCYTVITTMHKDTTKIEQSKEVTCNDQC